MKTVSSRLFIFLIAFAATAAYAAPKVGDSATLEGKFSGSGTKADVTTLQKITGYNANTGVYTIEQTQTVGADSQTKEIQVKAEDLMSEETATMIVQVCESQGIGKNEKVEVAAGSFTTCRVSNDGATLWVAPVPFGVVKLSTKITAGSVNLGLTKFTRGQ